MIADRKVAWAALLVVVLPAMVLASSTTWSPLNPQPGQQVTITYDPSGTGLADATWVKIHHMWNHDDNWYDADMTQNGANWEYTVTIPSDCLAFTFCFFDDTNDWDNNNALNWTLSSDAFGAGLAVQVASNAGVDLYAVVSGNTLHIAVTQPGASEDRFVLLQDDAGAGMVAAPWGKAGNVLAWDTHLAIEGSNSWNSWFDAGVTAYDDYADQSFAPIRDSWLDGTMLRGTVDLGHFYPSMPSWLYLAATGYGTNAGDALLAQAPVSLDADGDVDTDEFAQIEPCTIDIDSPCADCDDDFISDATEIALGAADCNLNAIPDSCDIADGTSLDTDGNSVPDECEMQMVLSLATDQAEYASGDQVVVTLTLSQVTGTVYGGQFALQYDTNVLSLVSSEVATGSPFTEIVPLPGWMTLDPGDMFFSVHTEEGQPAYSGSGPVDMGAFTFDIIAAASDCDVEDAVSFRATTPPYETRMAVAPGTPSYPDEMNNVNIFAVDFDAPVLTCPADITQDADAGQDYATVTITDATATDNCDASPVIEGTRSDGLLLADTYPLGTTTITWTATDAAGNQSTCQQTVNISDAEAPVITCPGDISQDNDVNLCDALVTITPATATDNDGIASIVGTRDDGDALTDPFPVGDTIITWVATDNAGLTASCQQTVTVIDAQDPTATPGTIDPCYADLASAEAAAIAATTPADNCTEVGNFTITADTVGDCSAVISVTVADEAGNTATTTYNTRIDNTSPVVADCPEDITVLAEAGTSSAVVTWTPPTATDVCSGTITPTSTHNPGDRFNQGTTTVTYTFVDECGNTSTCEFDVSVEANVVFSATIELQGPIEEELTRCVEFVFYADVCDAPAVTITEDVVFPQSLAGNSIATTTFVVPTGATYTCVTAQDKLHTLISRSDVTIVDDAFTADLTGVNLLLQGDLYDDPQDGMYTFDYIDIVDLGTYLFAWNATYDSDGDTILDGSTPCGNGFTAHADINGDGFVDSTDYAFITGNYLRVGEADCCSGKSLLNPLEAGPRTSISIYEASAIGLRHFKKLDVNRDRIFDESDVHYILTHGMTLPQPSPAKPNGVMSTRSTFSK